MSLSLHPLTLTVTLHLGLHLPSSTALIASAPVTNQASYKTPVLLSCTSWFVVVLYRVIIPVLLVCSKFLVFWSPAWFSRLRLSSRLPCDLSLVIIGLFSWIACYIPVCSCHDPACMTMSLSSPSNKSSLMDPLASRQSLLVTEQTSTTGSSSFSLGHSGMDFGLLCVGASLTVGVAEEERDNAVMAAAHPAHIMTAAPERDATDPLAAWLTRGNAATLERARAMTTAMDRIAQMAANVMDSIALMAATAVPVHKMAAASERVHTMAATAEPVHKMAAITELRHVTAAIQEPFKAMLFLSQAMLFLSQAKLELCQAMCQVELCPGAVSSQAGAVSNQAGAVSNQAGAVSNQAGAVSNQAGAVSNQAGAVSNQAGAVSNQAGAVSNQAGAVSNQAGAVSNQAGAVFPVSSQVAEPPHKMAATPEPPHKMAATPEPPHKMAATPEPPHKMAASPEPPHKMAATPEPPHKMAATSEPAKAPSAKPQPAQAVSVKPQPGHVMFSAPESAPIMAGLPEAVSDSSHAPPDGPDSSHAPSGPKSAPEITSDLKSAPEVSSGLKSAPEVPPDLKPDPELLSDLKPAPELPSDQETDPEASPVGEAAPMPPEVSASAVDPPMEAASLYRLSASPHTLSTSSISAFPRSQTVTRIPAPPGGLLRPAAPPPAPPPPAPLRPAAPLLRLLLRPEGPLRLLFHPGGLLRPFPYSVYLLCPCSPQVPDHDAGSCSAREGCGASCSALEGRSASEGFCASCFYPGGRPRLTLCLRLRPGWLLLCFRLHPGGYLLCRSCLNLWASLMDLVLQPSPCLPPIPPLPWTMSLSLHPLTLTVTLHLGLHLPSSTALIASAPVTNQASYKTPVLLSCTSCRLPCDLSLVIIGLFSWIACYIPVCSCHDPACMTMSLSSPSNKSSLMDPLASRQSLLITGKSKHTKPTGPFDERRETHLNILCVSVSDTGLRPDLSFMKEEGNDNNNRTIH
ncbi:hypothetical protein H4Q32_023348 [Labeo rohita]|uniref:Uncharacterized protein n=1 Tax=Labeo rohita TaxID=84645 RepID=A0ABQ8MA33_LABRO|nr:hypothetical protein H4Q32_023348 [Labeo rohita]